MVMHRVIELNASAGAGPVARARTLSCLRFYPAVKRAA